jgi:hypothetical protein
MSDRKNREEISTNDLSYILEVNQKAIELNIEVEKQNEQVINLLNDVRQATEKMEEKLEEIDRSLFRLMVLLSSSGAGIIFTLIQQFLHH